MHGLPQSLKQHIQDSVVKIYVKVNQYDFSEACRSPSQLYATGSGVVLKNNQIMTNAHVVEGHVHIEVRVATDSKKYKATVKKIGHDCDLCLLTVEDPEFWQKTTPLDFGSMPQTNDEVRVWGFPLDSEDLIMTDGRVSAGRVIMHYVHSGVPLIAAQISAAMNPGNSGGPATTVAGNIVGIAHQKRVGAESFNYIIPVSVIKHFLQDGLNEEYKGFPGLAIGIQKLSNKGLRERLMLPLDNCGVRVTGVHPLSSAAGILKPNDVLRKINGTVINSDSYITLPDKQRIDFCHLITSAKIGDTLTFEIIREGQVLEASCTLKHPVGSLRLVPLLKERQKPTYYIAGGLVFQPLTFNYLLDFSKRHEEIPLRLLSLSQISCKSALQNELVIIGHVMANEDNQGYHNLCHSIILSANGKPVRSFADFVSHLEQNENNVHEFVTDNNLLVVIPNRTRAQELKNLQKLYPIKKSCSDDVFLFSRLLSKSPTEQSMQSSVAKKVVSSASSGPPMIHIHKNLCIQPDKPLTLHGSKKKGLKSSLFF